MLFNLPGLEFKIYFYLMKATCTEVAGIAQVKALTFNDTRTSFCFPVLGVSQARHLVPCFSSY